MKRQQRNVEIREKAKENDIFFWELADYVGISNSTIMNWLRRELPADKKEMLLNAISQIAAERGEN